MRGDPEALYPAVCMVDGYGKAHVIKRVRPAVADFAARMEGKLAAKDGKKTHWLQQPVAAIRRFLNIEVQELEAAMDFLSLDEQMGECVDVGNYSLILWDRLRVEVAALHTKGEAIADAQAGLDAGHGVPGRPDVAPETVSPVPDPTERPDEAIS